MDCFTHFGSSIQKYQLVFVFIAYRKNLCFSRCQEGKLWMNIGAGVQVR